MVERIIFICNITCYLLLYSTFFKSQENHKNIPISRNGWLFELFFLDIVYLNLT